MKKKSLATVTLVLLMVMTSVTSAFAGPWDSTGVYPSDVINTPHLTPVKFLMDRKILTGDADGLFHPERTITRAEFATIMAKATKNTSQLPADEKQNYFNDLDGYGWAKGYINACNRVGMIQGVGEGKFSPNTELTYAQVITILIRSKNPSAVTTGTWPDNYIQYAEMYMNSVIWDRNIKDWNAPATRGDVVMMTYRTMPKK